MANEDDDVVPDVIEVAEGQDLENTEPEDVKVVITTVVVVPATVSASDISKMITINNSSIEESNRIIAAHTDSIQDMIQQNVDLQAKLDNIMVIVNKAINEG